MDNPFELVIWAIAVGFAWLMLAGITGIDDWLKKIIGRKNSAAELAAKIEALEKRLAQLEDKSSTPNNALQATREDARA